MGHFEILTFRFSLDCVTALATMVSMKKSKMPRDINQLAFAIVQQSTSDPKPDQPEESQKNHAAVEVGRLGGLKGGKARAGKLTPEQRKESDRKAAKARWNKHSETK